MTVLSKKLCTLQSEQWWREWSGPELRLRPNGLGCNSVQSSWHSVLTDFSEFIYLGKVLWLLFVRATWPLFTQTNCRQKKPGRCELVNHIWMPWETATYCRTTRSSPSGLSLVLALTLACLHHGNSFPWIQDSQILSKTYSSWKGSKYTHTATFTLTKANMQHYSWHHPVFPGKEPQICSR